LSKELYTVTLESPAAIIEKDSSRSDTVRQRLQQVDSSLTLNTFERGDLFAETKANNFWRDWKFESFSEYVKKSGFDVSPRQADYEIQISNVSKLLGITLTQKAAAKNSKLKVIYELDPGKTVTDTDTLKEESMADIMRALVSDAPSKSLKELKEIVKRLKGETEEPEGELTWMNWPVRRDAKQVVVDAIELAVKLAGGTIDAMSKEAKDLSQASAISLIMGDYLADPNNQVDEFTDNDSSDFQDSIEDSDSEDVDDYVDESEEEFG